MKSYPIWNIINTDAYQTDKHYGARQLNDVIVYIGTSASNSHNFVRHKTIRQPSCYTTPTGEEIHYVLFEFLIKLPDEPTWQSITTKYLVDSTLYDYPPGHELFDMDAYTLDLL